MADAANTTPPGVLTLADLNTSVNHEPRVEDLRLAEALGMERPRNVRKLIERHREALERFGGICSTVERNPGRGRPGRTFWLNKRQALYLCTKSETPRATEVTIAMVEVFDAYQAGRLDTVQVKAHRRALPKTTKTTSEFPPIGGEGIALVQVEGKILTVDTRVFRVRDNEPVVRIHNDGRITVGVVTFDERFRLYGERCGLEPWHPTGRGTQMERSPVAVLGLVIGETKARRAPASAAPMKPRRVAAKPHRTMLPTQVLPDLAGIEAVGAA